ncbi:MULTISPECIES: hypothetical protein [unclassified Micromonospora]|uniref:hypothetical protein n=1 Tax=unclassified Micromonospora TaxID=2617518 RepID=UPI003A8447A1
MVATQSAVSERILVLESSASFLGLFAELEPGHLVTARVTGGAGAALGRRVHVRS